MDSTEKLSFFMDETSAPYEDGENPFPRTKEDDEFDEMIIAKYHLTTNMRILFPSSFFSLKKVDEDLQEEYDAAKDTGLFNIVFFDYEKWFDEGRLVLSEIPDEPLYAIHRGWMMKPEVYDRFYEQLMQNNIKLITTPKEYAQMHVFPNVYPMVKEDTARMTVFPLHAQIPIEEVKKQFDRFLVKDYVKSVKGTEFPKYFDRTVTQEDFDNWMDVFYKYRGDLLTGGICIKEYLDLKQYGDKTNEYRVFYLRNEPITVSKNSGQDLAVPEPPKALIDKYKDLPSNFYTVDYAELSDGSWKIIEAGDGSVSGLSEGQDYGAFYRALHYVFCEDM